MSQIPGTGRIPSTGAPRGDQSTMRGPARAPGTGLRGPSTSSRLPGSSAAQGPCSTACPSSGAPPGVSGLVPGAGRLPYGASRLPPGISGLPPGAGRFPEGANRLPPGARLAPGVSSRLPGASGFTPSQQHVVFTGISRPPMAGLSKAVMAEVSRPTHDGKTTGRVISRTTFTGPAASAERRTVQIEMTKSTGSVASGPARPGIARPGMAKLGRPGASPGGRVAAAPEGRPGFGIGRPEGVRSGIGAPPGKAAKPPTRLQRFDQSISAELSRKNAASTTGTTTTSDTNLLDAVDKLARAEAAHTFAGAVAAADAAAALADDPYLAEEAAAQGARSFQAEIVDVVREDIPGDKSIQVLGYIGMTRPRYAAR